MSDTPPEGLTDDSGGFILEKTLVLVTVVIYAIALWTIALDVIGGIPIPGVSIGLGLIGLWGLFMLTVGRWIGDFFAWFEAI